MGEARLVYNVREDASCQPYDCDRHERPSQSTLKGNQRLVL
jgi:hypothetical protein